jgi:ribosome maturation factor RimP
LFRKVELEVPGTDKRDKQDLLAVEAVVRPVLAAHGIDLFDLQLRRERTGWILRVMIEREGSTAPSGGVSIDLCADISRDISAALDVSDPISHAYTLEVSSPGVERPLRHAADFQRFAGQTAKIVLSEPLPDGQSALRGKLQGVAGDQVVIDQGSGPIEAPLSLIKLAHLVFEFPSQPKRKNDPKQQSKRPKKGR